MISGSREKDMIEAANLLLDARRTHTPIADLPPALQPTSLEEVARVHDEMALAYEEIGGWKITFLYKPREIPFQAPLYSPYFRKPREGSGVADTFTLYRARNHLPPAG